MHAQYQPIIERFHADEDFRQAVLADAKSAVKQTFGIELPCEIRVVSEASGYRIEPVVSAGGDLSDEQLDLVAGGKGSSPASQPVTWNGGSVMSNAGGGILGNNSGTLISRIK